MFLDRYLLVYYIYNFICKSNHVLPFRRKKKCIRVQMYLAGKSEQEIEATTFDEEGEAIPPLNAPAHGTQHGNPGSRTGPGLTSHSCSSNGSDGDDSGGSPASQESASEHSLTSPATPGGGPLSVPSLGSPASIASPSTPGGAEDWFRGNVGYRPARPPVGTDPRDSKNPLSISSLTSCQPRQNGINGNDKMLGVT